jgi:hypothetical protein
MLWDHHRVGNPLGVEDLPNEARSEKPCDLFGDRLPPVLHKMQEALPDQYGIRPYIEGVLGEFPGYPGHVGGFPREDVFVCPEELDERAFLYVPEFVPDLDHPLGVVGFHADCLHLLSRLEGRLGHLLLAWRDLVNQSGPFGHSRLGGL